MKQKGYRVSGFFNSLMPCRQLIENTGLLDDLVEANSKAAQAIVTLKLVGKYDLAVLNYFSCSKKNILTAKTIAGKVIMCTTNDELASKKILQTKPEPGIHDAEQNLRLINEKGFNPEELSIPSLPRPDFMLPASYLLIQTSSGNPAIAYKNWPAHSWKELIHLLLEKYPAKNIVLTGNETDIPFCNELEKTNGSKVISLAGKTNITQLMQLVSNCSLFLGLDGGLMHLAAAYKKPTFTLWGPSSELLYGYEQFNPQLHKCVRTQVTCSPCNAWIGANNSRVNDPERCPDFACMKELTVQTVLGQFTKYVTSLPPHAW